MKSSKWLAAGVGLLLAGCADESGKHDAHKEAADGTYVEEKPSSTGTFEQMSDEALLADMSMSDVHFYPHRAKLRPMGEDRVRRLAALMDAHGGTVRMCGDVPEELQTQRTRIVRDMLAKMGVDTTVEVVTLDMAGGRGMSAQEAILIKQNEGTYKPSKGAGSNNYGDTTTSVITKP
jgi:hypothetical protein